MNIKLTPIGWVSSPRREITDDNWQEVQSVIELNQEICSEESLAELGTFSHIHILFYMDRVGEEKICYHSRHPRNNGDFPKVGIFAQRGKSRPNRIGLTRCEILKVEGVKIYVQGFDAIDGTPILDIKPVVREFDALEASRIQQPEWMTDIMENYF